MTKDDDITIDDLYSNAGIFSEEDVLRALQGKIIFTEEHAIRFAVDTDKLVVKDAVLLYALAKKILKIHQRIDSEATTNAEIIQSTNKQEKTSAVSMAIKRLKDDKLLMPSGKGYIIPNLKVAEVLELLEGTEG